MSQMSEPHVTPSCVLKELPAEKLIPGAKTAVRTSRANAPSQARVVLAPERIALLTTKYWGPRKRTLSVSFMDGAGQTLRQRIISHMNAWYTGGAGVRFAYTAGQGQVRIIRAPDGYWSYLGTDVLLIPADEPTMCLEGFTLRTPLSEYRRVIRHETGHTLGFPHEHMRRDIVAQIDPEKAYRYFWRTQRWDRQTVDSQVLTPLEDTTIRISGPVADRTSLMCYQLPGEIMRDGRPVAGGLDIDLEDQAFANSIYPRV